MADQQKVSENQDTNQPSADQEVEFVDAQVTTELITPSTSLEPPIESKQRSRPSSRNQTNTKEYRLASQYSRFNLLKNLTRYCSDTEYPSLEALTDHLDEIKDVWTRFKNDHEQLGISCRATLFSHDYVTSQVFENAQQVYHALLSELHRQKVTLQQKITRQSLERVQITEERTIQSRSQLPIMKLPQFNGDFGAWASFRDLFTSLVINHHQLSNVEKLHYLKTSIVGSAAQLISNVPLSNDSFDIAWGLITTRFDNKERQIFAHMEKLLNNTQQVNKSANDLHNLISSTKEVMDALMSLDVPIKHWDYVLIHVTSHRLENSLRECWEVHRDPWSHQQPLLNLLSLFKEEQEH